MKKPKNAKKPKKDSPKCPFCNSHLTIKKGYRKSKKRLTQRYKCKNKSCQKYFTLQPPLQSRKTYPIGLILNIITNINLGYSLKQTQSYFKGKAHKQKTKIPKSTLSYWYSQFKPYLPYHRIRNQIKANYTPINIIKKKQFTHHSQPFTYQYHQPKIDLFLKQYPSLKHYLENIENILPKDIFNNSKRISQIAKETPTTWVKTRLKRKFPYEVGKFPFGVGFSEDLEQREQGSKNVKHFLGGKSVFEPNVVVGVSSNKIQNINLTTKQNYATKLAGIALQITNNNTERHQIIENLMLINDTATIATEIPVYLKLKNKIITGHIDILQIRYNKLHILDYKPENINKEEAITQLQLYALALSKLTKIPLNKFKCAWFDQNSYYEFYPF